MIGYRFTWECSRGGMLKGEALGRGESGQIFG